LGEFDAEFADGGGQTELIAVTGGVPGGGPEADRRA
jgi:hypothetical protein